MRENIQWFCVHWQDKDVKSVDSVNAMYDHFNHMYVNFIFKKTTSNRQFKQSCDNYFHHIYLMINITDLYEVKKMSSGIFHYTKKQ